MKKRLSIISVGLILVILVGCGVKFSFNNNENSFGNPKSVATKYLTCLMKKDYDKAKTLATPETAQNLSMMQSMGADFGLTVVKDVKCIVSGNEATCTFCCTKDTSFKELKMRKEGGKWLAHQPKETPPIDNEDNNSNTDYLTPKSAEDMEKNRQKNR